jgi:hypothetical protein
VTKSDLDLVKEKKLSLYLIVASKFKCKLIFESLRIDITESNNPQFHSLREIKREREKKRLNEAIANNK